MIVIISPRALLRVYAGEDNRITENQAMRLFMAAIKPELWLVEGAAHTKVRTSMLDDLIQIIIAFFDDSLRNPSPGFNSIVQL